MDVQERARDVYTRLRARRSRPRLGPSRQRSKYRRRPAGADTHRTVRDQLHSSLLANIDNDSERIAKVLDESEGSDDSGGDGQGQGRGALGDAGRSGVES
jgi:hypothetical protein